MNPNDFILFSSSNVNSPLFVSHTFSQALLREQGVAVTPGIDFGEAGEGHIRFSYASNIPNIKKAFVKIRNFLGK